MGRIRLIHWQAEEASERASRIQALGYEVDCDQPEGRLFLRHLREDPPQGVVIDLSRLPSQGRDLAIQIRRQASTRHLPLVFVGGQADKIASIRDLLPDAIYAPWPEIRSALAGAIARPPQDPVVPDSVFAAYAGRPLVDKLGIKAGSAVALVSAPERFADTLGALPEGVELTWAAGRPCDLTLWFVRSCHDLEQGLDGIVAQAQHGPVWIAWPKKASALASDVTQQSVRDTCLAVGLVDYKVCAIDKTWSGLLFTQRK